MLGVASTGTATRAAAPLEVPANASAPLSETPSAGTLFYYFIAGVNADGKGILGKDGAGNAVPNGQPCADADGDLPANPAQCG
jgi:hypothetical protein